MLSDKIECLRTESQILDEFLFYHRYFIEDHKDSNLIVQITEAIESVDITAFRQLQSKVFEAEKIERKILRKKREIKQLEHLMNNALNFHKIDRT